MGFCAARRWGRQRRKNGVATGAIGKGSESPIEQQAQQKNDGGEVEHSPGPGAGKVVGQSSEPAQFKAPEHAEEDISPEPAGIAWPIAAEDADQRVDETGAH